MNRPGVRLRLKVRVLKAEGIEMLLFLRVRHLEPANKAACDRLLQLHHKMLLRCFGWRKQKREDHASSYANALVKSQDRLREQGGDGRQTKGILFADSVARMGEERLPSWVISREMIGGKGYSRAQEWDWIRDTEEDFEAAGVHFLPRPLFCVQYWS